MMRVSTDGRLVRVDLPQLKAELRIEGDHDGDLYDRDGRVVGHLVTRAQDTAALVAERAAVCRECDGGGPDAVRLTVKGRTLNRVRCKPAGCGNLSLVSGRCVKGLWPA